MWVFSTIGFFSIVRARPGSAGVQVRARTRADLERLLAVFKVRASIVATPRADYPYRIEVSQRVWLRIAVGLARRAKTYANFKNAASAVDPRRLGVLHEVWAATRRLTAQEDQDDGDDFDFAPFD